MPVNFTLVNDTGEASDARVLSFGQIFPSGAIYPGKAVSVSLNNIPVQSQIDPKALWPDGSVRHAVVSLLLPKMRRGEKLTGVIMPAANAAAMMPMSIRIPMTRISFWTARWSITQAMFTNTPTRIGTSVSVAVRRPRRACCLIWRC
jgi:hypothetical protein